MHLPADGNCSKYVIALDCDREEMLYFGGVYVSAQSLFFYFAISPLYYVLSSHAGGGCPYP